MLNTEQLRKFARLYLARKRLKHKYDELGKRLEEMEPGLIAHLIAEETDKISLKGGSVISIDTKIWPKLLRPREEVIEQLEKTGRESMIGKNYNTNTMASWLRELDAAGEDVPEDLKDFIAKNPVESLVVRKFK